MAEYIGYCGMVGCKKYREKISFEVPAEKVEIWRNQPPSCICCGEYLQGDIFETECGDLLDGIYETELT